MNREQFEDYARRGFKRIPVSLELSSDLDTPLSVLLKLADGAQSCLLESVYGGDRWGRYSIIGLPAATRIQAYGRRLQVISAGDTVEEHSPTNPLDWLQHYLSQRAAPRVAGLPRFCGGLVGYFGYEIVRHIEQRLEHIGGETLDVPDLDLLVCDEVAIFDNLRGSLRLVIHADPDASPHAYEQARERLDALAQKLATESPPSSTRRRPVGADGEAQLESSLTRAAYEDAVRDIQRHIVNGEVMQVVMSRRLSTPLATTPLDLYRVLRWMNPSPYMYFLDFGKLQVIGSSPEVMVRLEGDLVTVRPIAGTRPRGVDEEADRVLERELLEDPKELAEHLMLIDLGRNDVGRIAEVGSVTVTERMIIERYSHVMHIVSNVQGKLREGLGPMDVLRAAFPAGTLSGAPKIRAMEIIDELEPTHRHLYGGAVGYLSWSQNMDLAIAIRSAMVQDGILYTQVGAGVVADSKPASEWEETVHKSRAIRRAVALAEAGA